MIRFTKSIDKFIAERVLYMWFFHQPKCRGDQVVMNDALRVLNLFLNDEYVSSESKKEINSYINETTFVKNFF